MFRYNVYRKNNEVILEINLTTRRDGPQKLSLVHTGWRVVEGSSPRTVEPTFQDGATIFTMNLIRGQEVAVKITLAPELSPSKNVELSYRTGECLRQLSYINLRQY